MFNQPSQITEGDYRLELSYGANQQRNSMKQYKGKTLENTWVYVNKYYEKKVSESGYMYHYDYIYGENGVVALYVTRIPYSGESNGGSCEDNISTTKDMYYIHTDHLGSYCALTDAKKKVVQQNYFDPWGNYKPFYVTILILDSLTFPIDTAVHGGNDAQQGTFLLNFALTNRGFTGHEHYPELKIINMNGRLYDPVIGRFFSPDKYVANSSFTQDFNRYSYARNCPLMYTDPSGELTAAGWISPLSDIVRILVNMCDMFNDMDDIFKPDGPGKDFPNFNIPPDFFPNGVILDPVYITDNYDFTGPTPLDPGIPRGVIAGSALGFGPIPMGGNSGTSSNMPYTSPLNYQWQAASQLTFRNQTPWGGNGVAANLIGHIEFGYNMAVDGSLNATPFAKSLGMGLTGLSIIAEGMQMYNQYQNEGRVNPVTATNLGSNLMGLASKGMQWIGIGGRVVPFIGRVSGFTGMAITTAQSWWMIYSGMNDLRFAPLSIDQATGEPDYWITSDEYFYYQSLRNGW